MLQNGRVSTFIFPELFRENQQVWRGGGKIHTYTHTHTQTNTHTHAHMKIRVSSIRVLQLSTHFSD